MIMLSFYPAINCTRKLKLKYMEGRHKKYFPNEYPIQKDRNRELDKNNSDNVETSLNLSKVSFIESGTCCFVSKKAM